MHALSVEAGLCDLKGRYDLYGLIHKGLRRAQGEMLTRLGMADFAAPSAETLLNDLRRLLTLAKSHLAHEEDHVHAGLNRGESHTTALLERQHDAHRDGFIRLEALIRAVEAAEPADRQAMGRRLYLVFGLHVAHDLLHMFEEEAVAAPQLWATHSDAEIMAMEMAIIGSLSPEKNMAFLSLMIPAANREERANLLMGVKANAPREAYNAVMEIIARPCLSREDFADLSARLEPVPA